MTPSESMQDQFRPEDPSARPAHGDHYAALFVPVAYFFLSRVPTSRQRVGWLSSYLLPVLTMAMLANGGWTGIPIALLVIVAVYGAYEFGYMVNDSVTVDRESHPTLRLDADALRWFRARLRTALIVRFLIGLACMGVVAASSSRSAAIAMTGWMAIWLLFALYNARRGFSTILLYFLLNGLRYVLPVLAAAVGQLPDAWAVFMLLSVYALPNTYVAAWKPRYRLDFLRRPFGSEHRFRLAWYVGLTGLAALHMLVVRDTLSQPFVMLSAYYLILRLAASREDSTQRRGGPS
jgi:hypothetical protein